MILNLVDLTLKTFLLAIEMMVVRFELTTPRSQKVHHSYYFSYGEGFSEKDLPLKAGFSQKVIYATAT